MKKINIPISEINKEIVNCGGFPIPISIEIGEDNKGNFYTLNEDASPYECIGSKDSNCPQIRGIKRAIKKAEFLDNCKEEL